MHAALQAPQHNKKSGNIYACVCVFIPGSVDVLVGLPALPAWRLEITREKIYNCLVAWTSVSRVLGRNRRVDVEVEGMRRGVLKCTVVSWSNLAWQ